MTHELEQRYLDLVERNRGRIDRLCRSWSRSEVDREDLRSEVLFQLWRSLPGFSGRSSEDTWLFRVVVNVAMLHGRKRSRRPEYPADSTRFEQEQAPELSQGERLEQSERIERLRRAVSRLQPADRALVTLLLEELAHREIAEVLGIEANAVGVRIHRVKKKLARELADEECR